MHEVIMIFRRSGCLGVKYEDVFLISYMLTSTFSCFVDNDCKEKHETVELYLNNEFLY